MAKPLNWHGTNTNVTTRALDHSGTRYTIDRVGMSWVLVYLPTGNGAAGHQVIKVGEPRTLPKMKRAAAEHFATISGQEV